MALIYNDRAVLESHHASAAFRMMRQEECNILASMKKEDYKELRALVIEIVLATDMSFHFSQIKTMKSLLSLPDSIDKCKALSLIVHCADISHPAKSWELHTHWTELVVEEFFKQGDRESNLSLAISPLCDRKSTLVPESQIGFIDFIVDPSFQVMAEAVDKILNPLNEQTPKISSKASSELIDTSILPSNKFKIVRHWNDCLISNKQKWKEKSIEEKSARAVEEEMTKEPTEATETRIVSTPIATVMNVKEAGQTTNPPVDEVKDFPSSVTLEDTAIAETRRSSSIGDNDSFHSSLDSLLNSD